MRNHETTRRMKQRREANAAARDLEMCRIHNHLVGRAAAAKGQPNSNQSIGTVVSK